MKTALCAIGFLVWCLGAFAQSAGTIKGRVIGSDGQPAGFVNVGLKGLKYSTVTDKNGEFLMQNIEQGTYALVISFVGLKTEERPVQVMNSAVTTADFVLTEKATELLEVTVVTTRTINDKPVTAGKITIDPMDLPQSIAVIGQGVIRDQQALRLSDVIRNVNGVYLSGTRASTQESFSARGYAFSSSNMFKNGVRVNSGVMPEVSSLEKVEILKGSTAILYGNVAPGGIINMVTKQPKDIFGGEVSMRLGSYDLYKPSFDVYGPLSNGISYRVNGTYEGANSYRDNVHYKRYYINPALLFQLGKATELLVQADYLHHDFTPDFGIGTVNNTEISPLSRSTFLGTGWQYAKTRQTTASAALKHSFSDQWKLTTTVSYQRYARDYYSTERIQANSLGRWARPLGRTNTDEKYYIAQTDLTGKFSTGVFAHTFLAGIDADRYDITNDAFNQPAILDTINILDATKYDSESNIPAVTKIRRVQTRTNRAGAYVQDLVSLTAKLKLLAGIRYSYQKALPPDTLNFLTNMHYTGSSKADKAFSPRVGLVYRPWTSTSVFASYANSFTVNSGTDIYGNGLAPSIIDQYELGIKNEFIKGLLSANVTLYRIVNQNLAQVAQYTAAGVVNTNTTIKELTGQTTSDGLEVDIDAHPVAGLSVLGGYSYNYMRYTKTLPTKGNYITGERLINNPAHTANASVFYEFKNRILKNVKLGGTVVYIGNRFGGWNNTTGQIQNYSRLIPVSGIYYGRSFCRLHF